MVRSGTLCEYDYGKANMQKYGSDKPPVYDVKQISPETQIYLYWSPSDWLADQKGLVFKSYLKLLIY